MREPEWPLVCECKYDEVRDRMDRDDCLLHRDMEDDLSLPQVRPTALKKPTTTGKRDEKNVA
jgi:hypothetical protein